jgi:hypothetical protein
VKLRRGTETEAEAVEQVAGYLERLGLSSGWLVLFDQRQRRTWKQKLFTRKRKRGGHTIYIIGC